MGYLLGAFGVYLALVGALLAALPWWGAMAAVLGLLAIAIAAASEVGRVLLIAQTPESGEA